MDPVICVVGPKHGGTAVKVMVNENLASGSFASGARLEEAYCRFGEYALTPAAFLGPAALQCVSPHYAVTACQLGCRTSHDGNRCHEGCQPQAPGTVYVEVTIDNQHFTASQLFFTYYDDLALENIMPSRGPTSGATAITLSGVGFIDPMLCLLGGLETRATLISANQLYCSVPSASAGAINVAVRYHNSTEYSNSMNFMYEPTAIMSASPSSGPTNGGTSVHVFGHRISPSHTLACVLDGTVRLRASFISSTAVLCEQMPSIERPKLSVIQIRSANATIPGHAQFYYDAPAEVHALTPEWGPASGGTRLTISGLGFLESKMILCRFAPQDGGAPKVVSAHFISANRVTCPTPFAREQWSE